MQLQFPAYPKITTEVREAVLRQLESGAWTRLEGAPELERAWEVFQGGGHAWFVSSGTAALQAIMLGHGIGPGDEVITTPYTWGATVSAILMIGAIPVFADIDFATGQIDPSSVAARVGPKTRAIMAVHMYGIPAPMDTLAQVAREHGLLLFEDGSQAHGARLRGKRVGTFGDAAAFSCMALKPLAGTEGGFAQFRDAAAREAAYLYGRHPRGIEPERVDALRAAGLLDTLQMGWRPCALSAAIIGARLPDLDAQNAARRANARRLRERLNGFRAVRLIEETADSDPVYHMLSFTVDPDHCSCSRDDAIARLRAHGIGVFAYMPVPVHRMRRLGPAGYDGPEVFWHRWMRAAGIDYSTTSCPNAERRCALGMELGWNFTNDDPPSMDEMARRIRIAFND